MTASPELSAVVVHWRNEDEMADLLAAWPEDPRYELLVVDNSSSLGDMPPARRLDPGSNLGFAGGVNHGVAASRAPLLLLLNPDARPEPGALASLVGALAAHPEAAGVVPALVDADGGSQHAWQLQPLPSPMALVAQTLGLGGARGPRLPPPAGAAIEQPAAAALALRRTAFEAVGGFDESFYPAWFEDVDFARRLHTAGGVLRWAPAARFVHGRGASLPALGYGPFLWAYYRNLERYARRHHGGLLARMLRATTVLGMVLRLALLPLRRPRRAVSRRVAAKGAGAALIGALSGWRRPRGLARRLDRRPDPAPGDVR